MQIEGGAVGNLRADAWTALRNALAEDDQFWLQFIDGWLWQNEMA